MVCAIVAGVVAITRIATRHRERMARIGMGLDPDAADGSLGMGSERPSNAPTAGWDPLAAMRRPAPPEGHLRRRKKKQNKL